MSAVPWNLMDPTGGGEMELRCVRTGVILGSLVALAVVGCATGQTTTITGSGDPVADRQRLMKNNGANWADIQAKVKAGNVEAGAAKAAALRRLAHPEL